MTDIDQSTRRAREARECAEVAFARCRVADGIEPPRVVTGDRPSGPLHLGHLAGSLDARVALQGRFRQTVLVADLQALTDHAHDTARVRAGVREVVLDYLAVGIDPALTDVVLQSSVPQLAELTILFANLVSVARCGRNPTVKEEAGSKGMGTEMPLGFFIYPVSQAADIVGLGGAVVPVGSDQMPMIEQCNEVVATLARMAGRDVVHSCRGLLSATPRLPGADGRKASKTAGNAMALSTGKEGVAAFVKSMFTDPGHLRREDPGRVEGNVVFDHLQAFCEERDEVESLKSRYAKGGLGDAVLKARLVEVLEARLAPIRERRLAFAASPGAVEEALQTGTDGGVRVAREVLLRVRETFGLVDPGRRIPPKQVTVVA